MTVIIDGKAISKKVREELKATIESHFGESKKIGLAVIIVGENPASQVYVRNKINACKEVGITSLHYELPENTDENTIVDLIKELNANKDVYGMLVQLPLPKHLNAARILSYIDPKKDVDGYSSYQVGRLMLGEDALFSCTPNGVIKLLKEYNIPIDGKNAVVIGRSNTVGKPMAMLLLRENATVTICHSHTTDLKDIAQRADILVAAIGKPKFVTADMVKEGATVIDVGINRVDGKLCGDVDFEAVKDKCAYITPVPGGVGPMTVTMLISNTVEAALKNE